MTPISVRCRRCHSDFPLFTVVEQGTGACPHCWQPLAPGATAALLEWVAVTDAALARLAAAVHRLRQLDSHFLVDWRSVVQSLGEELDGNTPAVASATLPVASMQGRLRPAMQRRATARNRDRDGLRIEWKSAGADGK